MFLLLSFIINNIIAINYSTLKVGNYTIYLTIFKELVLATKFINYRDAG